MLQISSLHKAFGKRILFEDATWRLQPQDRVGLCGPNGVGKTTLLRMMACLDEPDLGTITKPANATVGYLPQDGLTHAGRTLFKETTASFGSLLTLQAEMNKLEAKLGNPNVPADEHDQMLARYSDAQEAFRHQGGYNIEAKVTVVLRGLGFTPTTFDEPTETFSGGWQMRIALAKLLLSRPDVLLLDEPTNHLDLEARNWLEESLSTYPGAVVVVSHDRFFLDSVVSEIVEVNLRTLTTYPGNYSNYIVERDARLTRLTEQKRRQDEEIARMQTFIDRFRYKATKAAQVQSRVKMLEKITRIEVPPERKRVHFTFPECVKSSRTVLELHEAKKSYSGLTVFDGINVHIERGDRIVLVGPNGVGKSTLMRMLSAAELPDAGTRVQGQQVIVQYFAQDEATRLDDLLTVYETLSVGSPTHMVPEIRNILGGFLFEEDDIYKQVRILSGGERTRLAVARMLLHPSNTLLLDEPTNHLDIDSTDVLLDALIDFGGTLVFVSHDRYFVDRLATKVLEIGNSDAVLYPGTYEEFRWSKQLRSRQASTVSPRARARKSSQPTTSATQHKQAQINARRQQHRVRELQTRITNLEQQISEHEQVIRELETTIAAEDFYSDENEAKKTIDRHQTLMWKVGDLMNQWEALHVEAGSLLKGGAEEDAL